MSGHEKVVIALKRFWPSLDQQVIASDVRGLQDVPPRVLLTAIEQYRQSDPQSAFPPTPARLRELAGYQVQDAALEAWKRFTSLPPIPVSSDVRWYDGTAQKIHQAWVEARSDPRFLAALEASKGATSASRRQRAFLGAFQEAQRLAGLEVGRPKELA